MRNKKDIVTIKFNKIQNTIREYFENLYCKKLKNLGEIDKLQSVCKMSKSKTEVISNLIRNITSMETKSIIKYLSSKKNTR